MSPVNQLSVLAFAAGALAVPGFRDHGHHHGHGHPHYSQSGTAAASGSGAPFPFPAENATGIYGSTGTGFATGTAAGSGYGPSAVGPATVTVSPYAADAASSTSECTSDVTITTTQRTYITVTATEESSSAEVSAVAESVSSSSSSAYPILSSYSAAVKAHGYHPHSWEHSSSSEVVSSAYSTSSSSSVYVAPTSSSISTSTSVYVAPTTSSTSIYVAPTTSSTSIYVAPTTSSTSTSTSVYVAPTTSSSSVYSASSTVSSAGGCASGKAGKRGLAYNDASLTDSFMEADQISWAYNWGSSSSGLGCNGANYVPLLWGTSDDFTGSWSENAAAAIAAGSEYLMSFNEPDLSSQANLSPEDAASAYMTYMQPFAGQAKLCAPAVTNGGGIMGLTWLSNFMDACTDCQIDCVSIHWYDSYSNADYFKDQVTNATTVSGKPVFVSEFGSTDGTDDDISTFLQDVMPWMDSNDDVAGYSYFMVSDGLLVSGTEPSSYGSTFMTYTG